MKFLKRLRGIFKKRLTFKEQELISRYLDFTGRRLFFQMDRVDQYHTLSVAGMLVTRTEIRQQADLNILIPAALLHDIGKADGNLNLASRILAGIVRRLYPTLRRRCVGKRQKHFWGRLRYSMYVDWAHPELGATKAQQAGLPEAVVQLIRSHHELPQPGQTPELVWLQYADDRN